MIMKLFHAHHNESKQVIRDHFQAAIQFLKKTALIKNGEKIHAADLPMYLMIGPSFSGKTTLLRQSELRFILEKTTTDSENIYTTNRYDWWVTSDFAIIDTPGQHFNATAEETAQPYRCFLKTMGTYKKQIQGIFLVLELGSIWQTNTAPLIQQIQRQLRLLIRTLKSPLPIQIIFNQCDVLPGFKEFFDEYGKEERWQVWGFQTTPDKRGKTPNFLDQYPKNFTQLLYRLNSQLLWKLQYEKDSMKSALISQFPSQVLQIRSHLTPFLKALCTPTKKMRFDWRGVFFTSATQKAPPKPVKTLKETEEHLAHNHFLIASQPYKHRGFFIHNLFDHLPVPFTPKTSHRFPIWIKGLAYAFAIGITSFAASHLLVNFNEQTKLINTAQQTLMAYQLSTHTPENPKSTSFENTILLLNTLRRAQYTLNQQSTRFQTPLFKTLSTKDMVKETHTAYRNALEKVLLPQIAEKFTRSIRQVTEAPVNKSETHLRTLYRALQGYLRLQQLNQANTDDIIYSLHESAPDMSIRTLHTISAYLRQAVELHVKLIEPNLAIIQRARHQLTVFPKTTLAKIILETMLPNNQPLELNLENNAAAKSVFTLASPHITILSLYTQDHFNQIYPVMLRASAQAALLGNDVIGRLKTNTNDATALEKSLQTLQAQVEKEYLTHYGAAWTDFLDNIQMVNFTQLDKLNEAIGILGSGQSPLLQLFDILQTQLVKPVSTQSEELQALYTFHHQQPGSKTATPQTLLAALVKLHDYLNQITTQKNTGEAALALTQLRFQNQGREDALAHLFEEIPLYPEPIRSWLNSLATNTWQLMLFEAQTYINNEWQQKILPKYYAQLDNRFPLRTLASNDITLESFQSFFSPDGIVEQFFNNHLAPFVDVHSTHWRLKTVDGGTLQLPNSTLNFFKKAAQLRNLYYGHFHQKIAIPFKIQFGKASENLDHAALTMGKQKLIHQPGTNLSQTTTTFIWPDNKQTAEMIFYHRDGIHYERLKTEGPWSWFKLLASTQIHRDNQANQYRGTFKKDDYSLAFNLTAINKHQNPFDLKRFTDIQFPKEI
jgi:type VI secretion system protein ImpL